jgi:RNA recognition motif-containing protein
MNDARMRSYGNSCFRPVQSVRYLLCLNRVIGNVDVAPRSSRDHPSAVNVHLPKDRISMAHQGFGFCEFLTEEDAEYACKIMNQIKLWGKPIRVNKVRATGLPIP